MKFTEGPLPGICLIQSEPHVDERGSFARIFCETELAGQGLPHRFVQASLSRNHRVGTVRGLHFQWPPSREGKLVRCVAGAIFDVMVDLRPSSETFMRHFAVPLSGESGMGVYIPQGFAHGFQTLSDDTTVLYQMSEAYRSGFDGGCRYDDPAFAIEWPRPPSAVSERDRNAPLFDPDAYRAEHALRASDPRTCRGAT